MERSFGVWDVDQAVVGMGNPYCTDDGVGVRVTRCLADQRSIRVWESRQGGVYLAQSLLGFSRVLIVDAASFLAPGACQLMPLAALEAAGGARRGPHGMNLTHALEALRTLLGQQGSGCHVGAEFSSAHDVSADVGVATISSRELRVPDVWALAIGIPPDPPFGEGLSPQVAAAVPAAVQEVRGWLNR